MAIAKKCDICGALYELYNTKNSVDKTNGIMFVNIDEHSKYYSHAAEDCCPSCMDSIKQHINTLRKGE